MTAAILDAWRSKVSADLYDREGFRCGPLLDVHGSLPLIVLLMLERERDKALLRSIMVGMVFSWAGLGVSLFHVDSVVLLMEMVICFGNVPSLLLLRFVKVLSFMIS